MDPALTQSPWDPRAEQELLDRAARGTHVLLEAGFVPHEDNQTLDQLLVSPEMFGNPYPIYHRLRAEDPVHWSDAWGCWVLTRYEDVTAVLRDYDRFTNVGRIAMFLDQLPEGVRAEIRPLY